MPTVADNIIDTLYRHGIEHVFIGSGGGMMYLSEAVKNHGKMKYTCFHHEQAAGYAAVGYAKYTGSPAVCIITSGCGGTNVLTPLLVAYQDYTPVIFIQGQTDSKYIDKTARKFGVQGMNIEPMVNHISDFYRVDDDGSSVGAVLRSCVDTPAWVEVPLNKQCEMLIS